MEDNYLMTDIDRLPGIVQKKGGKAGRLSITKNGNEWMIKFSYYNELRSSSISFIEAYVEILEKIENGDYLCKR